MAAYMLRMQSLSAWKEAGMGLPLGERWIRAAEEKEAKEKSAVSRNKEEKHGRMERERERERDGRKGGGKGGKVKETRIRREKI